MSDERLPWCNECEVIVVPDDDGDCHVCGSQVVLK